jgi:hypothetical protein
MNVECAAQHANMDVVETLHPAARCESMLRVDARERKSDINSSHDVYGDFVGVFF